MDITPLIGFFAGSAATTTALLGYAKLRGLKFLPLDLENLKTYFDNISLLELAEILALGAKYAKNGFTPEEARALGKRIIDAAAEK